MNRYISDLHLGHANVIKFDNRPFKNIEEMHKTIITNWNEVTDKDDTVFILGDFCWETEQGWEKYLQELKGKKVLIQGNHDIKSPNKNLKKYFLDIKPYKEITDNGRHIIMSHYPIPMHKAAYGEGCYMLYGHVHNTREEWFMRKWRHEIRRSCSERGHNRGQWYNVGCMMPWMNYTPQTLDEIIEKEKQYAIEFNGLKRDPVQWWERWE